MLDGKNLWRWSASKKGQVNLMELKCKCSFPYTNEFCFARKTCTMLQGVYVFCGKYDKQFSNVVSRVIVFCFAVKVSPKFCSTGQFDLFVLGNTAQKKYSNDTSY